MGERPLFARPTSPSSRSSGSLQQHDMVEISIPPPSAASSSSTPPPPPPPARLLWSKSHVYVHPTPFSAGNVCGYVSIVEQTVRRSRDESFLPKGTCGGLTPAPSPHLLACPSAISSLKFRSRKGSSCRGYLRRSPSVGSTTTPSSGPTARTGRSAGSASRTSQVRLRPLAAPPASDLTPRVLACFHHFVCRRLRPCRAHPRAGRVARVFCPASRRLLDHCLPALAQQVARQPDNQP